MAGYRLYADTLFITDMRRIGKFQREEDIALMLYFVVF